MKFKKAFERVWDEIQATNPTIIRDAIEAGLQAKPPISFQYLQMAAHYNIGKPVETIKHEVQQLPPLIIQPPPGVIVEAESVKALPERSSSNAE